MRNTIRQTCGSVASQLFRQKTATLAKGEEIPQNWIDRLISNELIRQAADEGNHTMLRDRLANYWQGSAGDFFYQEFSERFDSWFMGPHYSNVEALKKTLLRSSNKYRQLYEIGCGDGQVLNHLSRCLPNLNHFTGLDLNERIIARNSDFYLSDRLSFHACDAGEWLSENAEEGSVIFTYGGVLEYFLEQELTDMFTMLRQKSPIAISLVEPVYEDFDMKGETRSRTCGQEHSFSHNYRYLLEKAGYDIVHYQEPEMEFRWVMIVAEG